MGKHKIIVEHHDFDLNAEIETTEVGGKIFAIGRSGQKRELSPNWVKPLVDMSFEETYDKTVKALKEKFDTDLKEAMRVRDEARAKVSSVLDRQEKEKRDANKAEEKRLAEKAAAEKEAEKQLEIQKEKDAALLKEKIRHHAASVADVVESIEKEIELAEGEIALCEEKILLHENEIKEEKEFEKDSVVLEKRLSELNTSISEEKEKIKGFQSLIDRKTKEIAGAKSFGVTNH